MNLAMCLSKMCTNYFQNLTLCVFHISFKSTGNIEGYANYLDPMRIQPQWRDRFPKTDLLGG